MSDPLQRQIKFTKTAQKGMQALPEHVRSACMNIVRSLAEGTERGKKLRGPLHDLRSIRLGRTHRLIYRETPEEIQVIDVGPRGDSYKQ
ncbi:MAG TPA: type II toxin-antitoxin system RelE/ParE family toxin [Longimicrobiaceae bacterium]|nr:type II toxin-antitoxin system RelE/ParE family toxin [Longimicrobiaceae bacterium]